ncbi:phosphatidylethanolamine/phosphatidyl-N-methylethanolamine N-methyltransferase [Oxalobacteraceae bacterium GrIS 1.11]
MVAALSVQNGVRGVDDLLCSAWRAAGSSQAHLAREYGATTSEAFCALFANTAKVFNLRAEFFLSYLKSPASVGAVAPSSASLAKGLCRHARGAHHLIELGAGTGVITEHLRDKFPDTSLVVLERDAPMAAALRRRFRTCVVVADAVEERKDLFKDIPAQSVAVSSLPFRSLPEAVAVDIIALLKDFLMASPKRRLVQYTYGRKAPFDSPDVALVWTRQTLVLWNVPPAWVWTLEQARAAPES